MNLGESVRRIGVEPLREEYLVPLGLSVNALAMALGVPATRIHEIEKERRGVTADTAERLARHFGGDAASWLALRADYDLKTLATRDDIARKVSPREAAPA
jgi:addiction module HigA family antidote